MGPLVPLFLLGGAALAAGIAFGKKPAASAAAPTGAVTYDLSNPAQLQEVKRALAACTGALPGPEITSPVWSPATSKAWKAFIANTVKLALAGKSDAASLQRINDSVKGFTSSPATGVSIPTAPGLAALAMTATLTYDKANPQNGINYMRRYWPTLYAFGQKIGGGSKAVVIGPKLGADAKAAA